MSDREDDLAQAVSELEATMRELQQDLEAQTRRGPLGLPRPPSPSELLRFADEAAIPALIAILEANIRVLEALQQAVRLINAGSELPTDADQSRQRAVDAGEDALARFDRTLSDLQDFLETRPLPEDDRARDILDQARQLRIDLQKRIERAEQAADEDHATEESTTDSSRATDVATSDDHVDIDVDAELESIKDEVDDSPDAPDESASADGGTPADDDSSNS